MLLAFNSVQCNINLLMTCICHHHLAARNYRLKFTVVCWQLDILGRSSELVTSK